MRRRERCPKPGVVRAQEHPQSKNFHAATWPPAKPSHNLARPGDGRESAARSVLLSVVHALSRTAAARWCSRGGELRAVEPGPLGSTQCVEQASHAPRPLACGRLKSEGRPCASVLAGMRCTTRCGGCWRADASQRRLPAGKTYGEKDFGKPAWLARMKARSGAPMADQLLALRPEARTPGRSRESSR